MKKPSVLITGATGFIGQRFLQRIDKRRWQVFALGRRKPADFSMQGIADFFEQDISKPFRLNIPFDYVFHLAACNITHGGEPDLDIYRRMNVHGTQHVIEALSAQNLIVMSSAKVYARQGKAFNEQSVLGPARDYEKSKLEAEDICRTLYKGKLFILRSTNVVGPGQADKAIVPVCFKNALAGRPLEILAPLRTRLQLLYVDDLIDLFEKILAGQGMPGTYNVASPKAITLETLAKAIVRVCKSSSPVRSSIKGSVPFVPVDASKAKKTFQWQPKTPLESMLGDCHRYYKKAYEHKN